MRKVYACLTTMIERQASLIETVVSLLDQVDKLYIFLHGYRPDALPDILNNEKIELAYDLEWGDNGDSDKFHFVSELNGYILICDDDIIYPPDYAQKMIHAINSYDKKAIISCHGAIPFPLPIANYYLDRYVFPCLGTVEKQVQVPIGGTGVMAFHSSIDFSLDFRDKFKNMADIHVAIWAGLKGIPIVVLPHLEGWLRHSPYVKQEDTIYGKTFHNTFEQVALINAFPEVFKSKFVSKKKDPKVTVAVVNSRMHTEPQFVKDCYDSIRKQSYKNIEVVIIENYDKLVTIGKAFNDAVKKAKGEYILFLGDDDFISEDYVASLVTYLKANENKIANVVGVTSYLTMFFTNDYSEVIREPRELIPTGMWKVKFLKKRPFKEYLTRFVDSELMESVKEEGYVQLLASHLYGYYYRTHPGQISGKKALTGKAHGVLPNSTEQIMKRMKEIENAA